MDGTPLLAVFRVDASPGIGGGHVMRCLTLADTLTGRGWECGFVCAPGTTAVVAALARSGHSVREADPPVDPMALRTTWPGGCDLLVVDHYGLDAEYEAACRPWAKRILVIDDLADRPHDCDFLLDQTLGRAPEAYDGLIAGSCLVLSGPTHALLRPQFARARPWALARRREKRNVERILVSLGATDPNNITADILKGLSNAGTPAAIDIVIGAAAPHLERLRRTAGGLNLDVTFDIDREDMASLMTTADLAIGAAGTTSWERCCLGLPSLMVVAAENQRQVADNLAQRGAALIIGNHGAIETNVFATTFLELAGDSNKRQEMTIAAANICDGLGAGRIVQAIEPRRAKDGAAVRLRPATEGDSAMMLDWQSIPETRRYSRNPSTPERSEHEAWVRRQLSDPGCVFNIVLHGERPVGVLRLNRMGVSRDYEVSILVVPDDYRLGIANHALALGMELVFNATLTAYVLPENTASHRLFRKAGFRWDSGRYIREIA